MRTALADAGKTVGHLVVATVVAVLLSVVALIAIGRIFRPKASSTSMANRPTM